MLFSAYPALQSVGGSAKLSASGYSDSQCQQPDIIVVQTSAGKYQAFSSSCPHACAIIDYSGSGGFRCPRHGATFDLTGACTNGVTNGSLDVLSVCADANGVYVTIP